MKRLILRVFLLLLTLLMVIPFAGCQETPAPQETNPETDPAGSDPETDPTETDPGEEEGPVLPVKNYNNDAFVILTREQTEHLETLWVESITEKSSSLHRAVYQRLRNIGYEYGIAFEAKIASPSYLVSTNVKAGQDVFDLVSDHGNVQVSNAIKGYYYDWNDLPYVDLSAKWWSQEAVREFSTAGGKLFIGFGDIGYMSVGSGGCIFFNKTLLKDVQGLESPYTLVDEKKWDFATFEEYVLTMDANMDGGDGSGRVDTDVFGYVTGNYLGTSHYFHAAGARVLTRKNGEWRITIDNDTTNSAAFDMRELVLDSGAVGFLNDFDYSPTRTAFMQGRTAFVSALVNDAVFFADSDVRYGVLPFPKYTSRVKEYYTVVSAGTSLYTVMRNTTEENAERISIVLEAMAYDGYKTIMPLYYDVVLSYQALQDEDSLRMLNLIHDHLVLDLGAFLGIAGDVIYKAASDRESSSLSQLYGEIESTAQEKLLEWLALDTAWEEGLQ